MEYFTQFSQISFLIQFIITLPVTIYLYTKYKDDWMNFEKLFFLFFVFITISNLVAIFFITDTGLLYSLVVILSFLSLVFLLMAGETLMGIRNIYLLYIIPLIIFVVDTSINIFYAENLFGVDEVIHGAITGIDILLITIPALLIYIYLTYKTKDISLGFFVLAILLYLTGGFSLTRFGEVSMGIFYTLAVICFAIATVLPIVRNRLQVMSPPAK